MRRRIDDGWRAGSRPPLSCIGVTRGFWYPPNLGANLQIFVGCSRPRLEKQPFWHPGIGVYRNPRFDIHQPRPPGFGVYRNPAFRIHQPRPKTLPSTKMFSGGAWTTKSRNCPAAQARVRILHGIEKESMVRQNFCVQRPLLHERLGVRVAMLGQVPMPGVHPDLLMMFRPPSEDQESVRISEHGPCPENEDVLCVLCSDRHPRGASPPAHFTRSSR